MRDQVPAQFDLGHFDIPSQEVQNVELAGGQIPAGEEGAGTSEQMELPDIGDDRWGAITVFDEEGGWAEWRLHGGLIRDGAVLVMIIVGDIRADSEPYYTIDEVGEMMVTAHELLQQDS